MRTVVLDLE